MRFGKGPRIPEADFLTSADQGEHKMESLLHLDVPAAGVTANAVYTHNEKGPNLYIHVAGLAPVQRQIIIGQIEPEQNDRRGRAVCAARRLK